MALGTPVLAGPQTTVHPPQNHRLPPLAGLPVSQGLPPINDCLLWSRDSVMGWVSATVVQGVVAFVILGTLKRAGVIKCATYYCLFPTACLAPWPPHLQRLQSVVC